MIIIIILLIPLLGCAASVELRLGRTEAPGATAAPAGSSVGPGADRTPGATGRAVASLLEAYRAELAAACADGVLMPAACARHRAALAELAGANPPPAAAVERLEATAADHPRLAALARALRAVVDHGRV